jgi:hypothetical protein
MITPTHSMVWPILITIFLPLAIRTYQRVSR